MFPSQGAGASISKKMGPLPTPKANKFGMVAHVARFQGSAIPPPQGPQSLPSPILWDFLHALTSMKNSNKVMHGDR